MFDVFDGVKGLLKIDSVCIDSNIFRLHYKATVIVLIVFSLSVTSRQYIGDPIDCIVDHIPSDVMDSYCWIHSTFTLPNHTDDISVLWMAHPGVGPHVPGSDVRYHKYYQWVCFVLFFQAILFHAPRHLWKTWEGGRIKMLVLGLDNPIANLHKSAEQKKLLRDYFVTNLHKHNFYAYRYFVCEALNFANVVSQIYFMDLFLGGNFTTYGSDVAKGSIPDRISVMFPKMTKCTFHKFGDSGSIETHDGLCVLPLNVVNEKIYMFLWFWFVFLSVLSGVALLYRAASIFLPEVRDYILRSRCNLSPVEQVKLISSRCQIGDWFLLSQLGKNIEPLILKDLVEDLAMSLHGKGVAY